MRTTILGVGVAALILAGGVRAQSGVPNEFEAGQPARAADVNANFAALVALIEGLETQVGMLTARVAELETDLATIGESKADSESLTELTSIFEGVTRDIDPNTGIDTITVSGVNLQIVNGTGQTDLADGAGNLIIGYNEPGDAATCQDEARSDVQRSLCGVRTGSHTLVIGMANDYQGFGSLVAGHRSQVGAVYSVALGVANTASGGGATVTGGYHNHASYEYASVSGGEGNIASAYTASVSGGVGNVASGESASVTGGAENVAEGDSASITGGLQNYNGAIWSSITGGSENRILFDAVYSSISGGMNNEAGLHSTGGSITGGQYNQVDAGAATVAGGVGNQAGGGGDGYGSTISGGRNNYTVDGQYSSISGGQGNSTLAAYTSILGGQERTASTDNCVVGDDGNDC